MKITVFNGSPRGEKSNTHRIVEPFLEGARDAGAEVENIFLSKKHIKHCLGCFTCWTKTPGKCVQKDDMQELIPKVMETDIIVFATPLYVDNVSGMMKDFLDRLVPDADPHFETDENGEYRHVNNLKKVPKFVVISNCGFPEQSHFQVLEHYFRRVARNFHTEVIAEIYRGGGELLKVDSLLLKPILWNYKRLLKRAGKELVENLKFSEETIKDLAKPLISYEKYIKNANEYWDKVLQKIR